MSKAIDLDEFDEKTKGKMLSFLNCADSCELSNRTKGNPDFAAGHLADLPDCNIGPVLAKRIVARRYEEGGIFSSLDAVGRIPGLGQGKLRDIAHALKDSDDLLLTLLTPQVTFGNKVSVVVDGPDCLRVLREVINGAKTYIHLSVMLFFNDEVGKEIANLLAEKAKQGVEVRVMADGKATASGYRYAKAVATAEEADFGKIEKKLKHAGAKVVDTKEESYWEWRWNSKRRELRNDGVPEAFLAVQDLIQDEVQANFNVANHRKFMVVDGEVSIIASLNIGGQYLYTTALNNGLPRGEDQWHDGLFLIEGGQLAGLLNTVFASQWMVMPGGDVYDYSSEKYNPTVQPKGTDECTVLTSFPGSPINFIREYFCNMPAHVEGPLIIENPYIFDESFFGTLAGLDKSQAKKIKICNPYTINDHRFNDESIKCNMWKPCDRQVSYYDYAACERFSHWKIAYDRKNDCVMYGSYNINMRSAIHDFELNVLVKSKAVADRVKELLLFDLSVSQKKKKSDFFKRPGWHLTCYWEDIVDHFS